MLVNIIILLALLVAIIICLYASEEKDLTFLTVFLSFMLGMVFLGSALESSGITVDESNEKGYNVWKEETKIGDKVVKTTWHVAPKK